MTKYQETESGSKGNAGLEAETSLDTIIQQTLDGFDDDDGNFKAADKGAIEEIDESTESAGKADIPEEEANAEGEESGKLDILTAPEHWTDERKAIFQSMPPAAQRAWLDQAKDYERGLAKSGEKHAEFRKTWESVDTNLKSFESLIGQTGLSKPEFINEIMKGYAGLVQNPLAHIQWVMQQAGIKPDQLVSNHKPKEEEQEFIDPTVKKLHDELNEMKLGYANIQQVLAKAAQAGQVDKMSAFIANAPSEKDENGNPLYPHFDEEMADEMADIIASSPAIKALGNPAEKFRMAYQLAVGKNQSKILERELAKRMAEQEAERSKAARTIKPAPGSNGTARKGGQSLDDIILEAMDKFNVG